MKSLSYVTLLGLGLLYSAAVAQQGLLTDGDSVLPSCAQSCTLLQQAATACSGTTTADQTVWSCFCQSAYLKQLYSSDTGICDSVCTDPSDSQQVSTWYRTNCGNDNGASEHSNDTPTTTAAPGVPAATTTSAVAPASSDAKKSWWSTHYQWIVMLLVLAIGLTGLAFALIWFKKWRRRRQDRITGSFNSGITTRHAPTTLPTTAPPTNHPNASRVSVTHSATLDSTQQYPNGDAPLRTRDSFMPYGYGYTRSETRLGYQTERAASFSRNSTPVGVFEKQAVTNERPLPPDTPPSRPWSGRNLLSRDRNSRISQGPDGHALPEEPAEPGEKDAPV